MESQTISDAQITASSEYHPSPSHGARNARLNFQAGSGRTGAWSALLPDSSPWLQVDFTRIVALAKIATQGRSDYDQWVTSYSLSYSVDRYHFEMYKQCGEIKVRINTSAREARSADTIGNKVWLSRYPRYYIKAVLPTLACATDETKLCLNQSAKQPQNSYWGAPPLYQDFSTCHTC